MTAGAVSELNQTLDAAGVDYTSEVYPCTIHGFTMADTDAFSPSALQRHWDRLLPLLARTLAIGGGPGLMTPRLRCGIVLSSEEDACQVLSEGKIVSVRYAP